MAEKQLDYYQTEDGVKPFERWLARLRDRKAVIEVDKRLRRVTLGNLGDHRSVGEGVVELRIHYGPGYRVYVGQRGDRLVILLQGGDKGSQSKDIELAKAYWADWKERES
jgi:putative addiction module killer protein